MKNKMSNPERDDIIIEKRMKNKMSNPAKDDIIVEK